MKSAITVAAVAGLATVAAAQNVGTITVTAADMTIGIGQMTTISVVLSDNIAGNSVFAFDVDVTAAGDAGFSLSDLAPEASVFGWNGGLAGNVASGLGGSSDILGPDLDPSLDDLAVFSFKVMGTSEGSISFTASDGAGPNPAIQWGSGGGIVINPEVYDSIEFVGATVRVTPAPSGMALLGLGGLAVARRRR
ncbi:MAG: hypothetical protein ACIARR_00350 [Phycisphaerales bacterium JB059]